MIRFLRVLASLKTSEQTADCVTGFFEETFTIISKRL